MKQAIMEMAMLMMRPSMMRLLMMMRAPQIL